MTVTTIDTTTALRILPRRRSVDWRGAISAWAFIAPALLIVLCLVLYPLGFGGVVSAYSYDLISQTAYFIGLDNYAELLNGDFGHSALVTLEYAVPSVIGELIVGVAVASLLQAPTLAKARPVILAIIMMPLLMAPVVSGSTFRLLLNPDVGLLARALGGIDILGNRQLALFGLILIDIWMWTPFVVLLVTAALLGISPEIMEAAALDGAGPWQRFRHVVLPLIRPVLVIIVLFRIIDTVKTADMPYVMTQGGPGSATNLVSLLVFRTSFGTFNIGLGAAMSVVIVLVLMLPVLALYRSTMGGQRR
jgi:multiple sugar transport system permease protein